MTKIYQITLTILLILITMSLRSILIDLDLICNNKIEDICNKRSESKLRNSPFDSVVPKLMNSDTTSFLDNLTPALKREIIIAGLNIYHEGRSSTEDNHYNIAKVTLERVKSNIYASTIEEVVAQNNQFTWVVERKDYYPYETNIWRICLYRAKRSYQMMAKYGSIGFKGEVASGTMYFVKDTVLAKVRKTWGKNMNIVRESDNIIYLSNRS